MKVVSLAVVTALYVGAIVVANVLTANEPPLTFDFLGQVWVITWGTWFIAATFFLRDSVQMLSNRTIAYGAIAVALLSTIALSRHYEDLAWVTVGSALAFGISESMDTEVFTRLRQRVGARIAISGVVGGTIDSVVFALVGLSPLTTGIVPWEYLWTTVLAQVIIKTGASAVVGLTVASAEPETA